MLPHPLDDARAAASCPRPPRALLRRLRASSASWTAPSEDGASEQSVSASSLVSHCRWCKSETSAAPPSSGRRHLIVWGEAAASPSAAAPVERMTVPRQLLLGRSGSPPQRRPLPLRAPRSPSPVPSPPPARPHQAGPPGRCRCSHPGRSPGRGRNAPPPALETARLLLA